VYALVYDDNTSKIATSTTSKIQNTVVGDVWWYRQSIFLMMTVLYRWLLLR